MERPDTIVVTFPRTGVQLNNLSISTPHWLDKAVNTFESMTHEKRFYGKMIIEHGFMKLKKRTRMLPVSWTQAEKLMNSFRQFGARAFGCMLLLGAIGNFQAYGQTGAAISTATKSGLAKSNQSKVFYHDGKWWAIAFHTSDSRWYIWKFSGGTWTKTTELNKSSTLKYDAVVNSAAGKLYVMGSHASSSEFWRFTYSISSATWTKDTGFNVNPSFTNSDAANPVSLAQAKNGDLWIFRAASNKLEAKRSIDGGVTWPAVITVKTGLTTAAATTDAVVFSSGGNNYVGVAYGEPDAAGSKYGFLFHRDGDPDATWTDDSSSLTFFGSERANNKIAATTDKNNNVYLLTQNAGVSGGDPNNTLYKRSSAGAWTKFVVNDNAAGLNWKTPAMVADTSNNALYVMGVNTSTQFAEYKVCAIGAETNLSAAATMLALSAGGASFEDLSLPAPFVNTASGLMVCGDNITASDIWYNQFAVGPIGGGQPAVVVNSAGVSPNEANTAGGYTIALTLGDQGALAAGMGAITIQFPVNTSVPSGIAANQITVNGTPATAVTSNGSAREVIVTTPVDLANSATVSLVFSAGANILNPSNAGNYSLQVSTSAQTTPANSPSYAISAATTTVSAAIVTPNPTTTSAAAAYTINFNLGARGRLISGSSTIMLTFNNSTGVASGSLSGVQVNGASATATGNSGNKTVTITAPAALSLGNSAAVAINLPAPAITNPASAGNYTLTAATNVESAAMTSNLYTIEFVGAVTVGVITLSTHEANANSSYTVPLTLGSSGALAAGSGTITIQFPNNTSVPGSITASQITVNGTAATAVAANSSTREVTITTPVNLPNNAGVSIFFNSGANLLNPSNAGNYALNAWTSAQPAPASSPAYSIAAATTTVSAASVTPNPNTTSSAAAYTISFNLGSRGRLISGSSTITVTFNSATTVSNGSLSGVQVNGAGATATGNSGNRTVTMTVPAASTLGNNAAVTISLPSSAISNPASAGNYTLMVATSVETTPVTSNVYSINSSAPPPTGEDEPITGTTGGYDKPHQNRPFYHAGIWWTAAKKSSNGRWYLWKLNGSSWSAELEIDDRKSTRPDCYVDSPANKLYILLASSSSTGTKILRLSYSGGAWSIDSGFPVVLSSFAFAGESGNVLVKAKNGDLWSFRYKSSKVDGQRSSDGGLTWSSTFTVKSSLGSSGLCDAVAFTSGGENYVGVGYAENTASSGKFGFLIHKDGDPDGSWTDETSVMPQFSGAQSDDHISLAVSQNNEIFVVCKTHPNAGSAAGIGLLKRSTGGSWQNFTIQVGGGWTRPAVVVDETNNELYVFGTQETSPEHGQYKKCAIGNESSLKDATPVDIFDDTGFNNLSAPQHRVTGATEMLVCVEKSSGSEIWYNLLPISGSGGGSSPTPLVVNSVTVNPSTTGQTSAYTLSLTLGSSGALSGGSGTITVTWPNGTIIPAAIAGSAVTVNGNNANNITPIPASRQAVITIASSLSNSASVSLIFTNAAGIVNPSATGNYTLAVRTSAEPAEVNSSAYNIQNNPPPGTAGALAEANTTAALNKSNQSKLFYFQSAWWLVAFDANATDWFLWKFQSGAWSRDFKIETRSTARLDVVLDSANSRLYFVSSHSSTTKFGRLLYSNGTWTNEMALLSLADFGQGSSANPVSMARANNGELWVFRLNAGILETKQSTDNGESWSSPITLKTGLAGSDGVTDGVTFPENGNHFTGVFYGMTAASGGTSYGFLAHRNDDPANVWTDESGALAFFGAERADDGVNVAKSDNGKLFVLTRNSSAAAAGEVKNTLYKRNAAGSWSKFKVNTDVEWSSPAVGIDDSNDRVYVMGIRTDSPNYAEYKFCDFGNESVLETQTPGLLLKNGGDNFADLTAPGKSVSSSSGLLVCGGNVTAGDVWYQQINFSAPKIVAANNGAETSNAADEWSGVAAYPNPFNPATTIRFKLNAPASVALQIFDIRGALVKTLVERDLNAGVHEQRWNGRDNSGRHVASGIYFYRLRIGREVFRGRLEMVK